MAAAVLLDERLLSFGQPLDCLPLDWLLLGTRVGVLDLVAAKACPIPMTPPNKALAATPITTIALRTLGKAIQDHLLSGQ